MSNLDELARAVRQQESKALAAPPPVVVEYRSPPPRAPWRLPSLPLVSLSRTVGWILTAGGLSFVAFSVLLFVGSLVVRFSPRGLDRAGGIMGIVASLAPLGSGLMISAIGLIVLLLAELVVQGRAPASAS